MQLLAPIFLVIKTFKQKFSHLRSLKLILYLLPSFFSNLKFYQ